MVVARLALPALLLLALACFAGPTPFTPTGDSTSSENDSLFTASSPETTAFIEKWDIHPDRIVLMNPEDKQHDFWSDRFPVMLVGCITDSGVEKIGHRLEIILTQDGEIERENFKASVNGEFKPEPKDGECYEIVAVHSGSVSYCFFLDKYDADPSCTTEGAWSEFVAKFHLYKDAYRKIEN